MTKNEIARNTNKTIKGIARTIALDHKVEYKIGQVLAVENAESWTNGGQFYVETEREYEYVFICENEVEVHEVNYSLYDEAETEEDYEILGTDEDSYEEKEVLVPAGTRFEIVDVASDSDYEEMGYYEIKVKRI